MKPPSNGPPPVARSGMRATIRFERGSIRISSPEPNEGAGLPIAHTEPAATRTGRLGTDADPGGRTSRR
jgi:hypothetical protein